MEIPDCKWRDRIVSFTCWAILLFSAIGNWADQAIVMPVDRLISVKVWPSIEANIFLVVFFLILIAPILLILLSRMSHSLSTYLLRFQTTRIFWFPLFIVNLVQFVRFSEELKQNLYIEFVMIGLGLLIILWLFYKRSTIDMGKIVFVGITWMSILTICQTLSLLPGRVDFVTASFFAKGFILLHGFILMVVIFLPLALFIRIEWESAGRRFLIEKLPDRFYVTILAFALIWMVAFQWLRGISFQTELGYRLGVLALVICSGLFLLWIVIRDSTYSLKQNVTLPKSLYIVLLCTLFLAYGVMVFIIGINNIENMEFDAISYLTIAWRYAEGHFAVRGIWSPMISWLIAPLIRLSINPHIGFFIVGGISGFVWLIVTVGLAKRYRVSRPIRLAIVATLIGITLVYGYRMRAADLLGATFVSIYFYWITHPGYEQRPIRYGFLAGLSGVCAYYGKYYNLPFVLVSLILTAILFVLHGRRFRSTLVGLLVSTGILLVYVSPWVIALNQRYGQLTISTSGGINHAVVGPNKTGNLCGHFIMCDQPSDVLLPWEDLRPQYYVDYGWSLFDSLDNFQHFFRLLKHNIWDWISMMGSEFSPIVPMTLLGLGVAIFYLWPSSKQRFCHSWALITILLYIAGYMPSFSHLRFYLAIFPILLIAAFSFVQALWNKARGLVRGKFSTVMLNVAFAASLVIIIVASGRFDYVKYYLQTKYDPCINTFANYVGVKQCWTI